MRLCGIFMFCLKWRRMVPNFVVLPTALPNEKAYARPMRTAM